MFPISNNELKKKPKIQEYVKCKHCGEKHSITFGKKEVDGRYIEDTLLSFYDCGEKSYLYGIGGKQIF